MQNTECMKDILKYIVEHIDLENADVDIDFDIDSMKSYCEQKYSHEEISYSLNELFKIISQQL